MIKNFELKNHPDDNALNIQTFERVWSFQCVGLRVFRDIWVPQGFPVRNRFSRKNCLRWGLQSKRPFLKNAHTTVTTTPKELFWNPVLRAWGFPRNASPSQPAHIWSCSTSIHHRICASESKCPWQEEVSKLCLDYKNIRHNGKYQFRFELVILKPPVCGKIKNWYAHTKHVHEQGPPPAPPVETGFPIWTRNGSSACEICSSKAPWQWLCLKHSFFFVICACKGWSTMHMYCMSFNSVIRIQCISFNYSINNVKKVTTDVVLWSKWSDEKIHHYFFMRFPCPVIFKWNDLKTCSWQCFWFKISVFQWNVVFFKKQTKLRFTRGTREKTPTESELYALASARKVAKNFRLLIRESFATNVIMTLRCDNTAAIAMLEEPGWRTRYISIYGEAARQEMVNNTMTLTYVSTDKQLADPLTKPTSALVNSLILPQ